jgi:hypothetical protein
MMRLSFLIFKIEKVSHVSSSFRISAIGIYLLELAHWCIQSNMFAHVIIAQSDQQKALLSDSPGSSDDIPKIKWHLQMLSVCLKDVNSFHIEVSLKFILTTLTHLM